MSFGGKEDVPVGGGEAAHSVPEVFVERGIFFMYFLPRKLIVLIL